jgi:FdhD protein
MDDFIVAPDPQDKRLTRTVAGIDQTGAAVETKVPVERQRCIGTARRSSL